MCIGRLDFLNLLSNWMTFPFILNVQSWSLGENLYWEKPCISLISLIYHILTELTGPQASS